MAYLVSASYALFAIVAANFGAADDGEVSISQMSTPGNSPAFVDQLPETTVVPVPGADAARPKIERAAAKPVAKRLPPVHSVFPSIGSGVNATADGAPAEVHLPTVGAGATGSL